MTELDEVYENADRNYRESLRLLGDSVLLVQDFVDLYQRISEVVASSKLGANDEYVMGLKFLQGARYYLVVGITDCLRCHLTDSFAKTRMAIEHAAFAARVGRHPHFAKIWLEAGHDDAAYEEYREKFKKLFPRDHALLNLLGGRYDMCAKQTHPSIYSFAGRSKVTESAEHFTFTFEYFQAESDGSEPVRTFFFIVNTHMQISNLFLGVLGDALVNDAKALEVRASSTEVKYALQVSRWLERIPALRSLVK